MRFEDLIDRAKVLELLERGTGKGVRVGVLDSGVDFSHPAFDKVEHRSFEVRESRGSYVVEEASVEDYIGHGTMCAGVIHEIAPDAELHSIKILDENGNNSPAKVMCGIQCAISNELHILNLSLASVNLSKNSIADMLSWVEKAYYKGITLVAATDNRQKCGFPADYSSVIAVDFQHFPDFREFNFRMGMATEIEAKGVYIKAPVPGNKYTITSCTSIACPHITGIAARLLSSIPNLTPFQLKTLLYELRRHEE